MAATTISPSSESQTLTGRSRSLLFRFGSNTLAIPMKLKINLRFELRTSLILLQVFTELGRITVNWDKHELLHKRNMTLLSSCFSVLSSRISSKINNRNWNYSKFTHPDLEFVNRRLYHIRDKSAVKHHRRMRKIELWITVESKRKLTVFEFRCGGSLGISRYVPSFLLLLL